MTTMVVPFATHTAWDLWIRPIVRTDPLPKGYCMYMLRRVKLPHSFHLQIEEAFILASTHANDSVFAPITQFTH